jgi:alkanesulfonate monooxygenase SsuD/methylene tetrahydromethanopterin reductase-like flavin-dependent oxidoreductase (luciferase family)
MTETAQRVKEAKDAAAQHGRDLDVYAVGVVTCRPTQKEAEEYYHYATIENADWSAVDGILGKTNISPATVGEEEFQKQRHHYAHGLGGLMMVGDPDQIAKQLAELSQAGLRGIGFSFVNYLRELPYFCDEVLPRLERMGIREKR